MIHLNRQYEYSNSECSHNTINTKENNNHPLEFSMTFANINDLIQFEEDISER